MAKALTTASVRKRAHDVPVVGDVRGQPLHARTLAPARNGCRGRGRDPSRIYPIGGGVVRTRAGVHRLPGVVQRRQQAEQHEEEQGVAHVDVAGRRARAARRSTSPTLTTTRTPKATARPSRAERAPGRGQDEGGVDHHEGRDADEQLQVAARDPGQGLRRRSPTAARRARPSPASTHDHTRTWRRARRRARRRCPSPPAAGRPPARSGQSAGSRRGRTTNHSTAARRPAAPMSSGQAQATSRQGVGEVELGDVDPVLLGQLDEDPDQRRRDDPAAAPNRSGSQRDRTAS